MLTRLLEWVAAAAMAVVWLFVFIGAANGLVLISPIYLALKAGKWMSGSKSA